MAKKKYKTSKSKNTNLFSRRFKRKLIRFLIIGTVIAGGYFYLNPEKIETIQSASK